ncbi:MAG: insulinase family protein, partial [Bacteroidota bacterium]
GLIESVKGIMLDDVKSFYKTYYMRENFSIGLGGGYDAALVDELKKDLQKLPAGAVKAVAKPEAKPIKGKRVVIVEKDAASTAMSMGFPINISRESKEWYALAVANSWLGQHRNQSSHLYQVIREERGLNYGDYAYIEHFPNAGALRVPPQNVCRRQQIFEIWIRPVPNETRHFALRAALRELKKLVDNGMTEKDFTLTRAFLKNFVLHYAPTTAERLGYALDDKFYRIEGSHLKKFREMMDKVTLKDVNAAIKKYWQYDDMQIAIVTKDAQSLKDALVNETASPITYKSPKSQHVLDEDKEISTFPLGIKAEDITVVPVAELFVK